MCSLNVWRAEFGTLTPFPPGRARTSSRHGARKGSNSSFTRSGHSSCATCPTPSSTTAREHPTAPATRARGIGGPAAPPAPGAASPGPSRPAGAAGDPACRRSPAPAATAPHPLPPLQWPPVIAPDQAPECPHVPGPLRGGPVFIHVARRIAAAAAGHEVQHHPVQPPRRQPRHDCPHRRVGQPREQADERNTPEADSADHGYAGYTPGELQRDVQRQPSTERMPHEGRALDGQRVEQLLDKPAIADTP